LNPGEKACEIWIIGYFVVRWVDDGERRYSEELQCPNNQG
jgi:hypothetical protein